MRKVSLILTVAVVTFLVACGSSDKRKKFSDVVDYNDYIVDILDNTVDAWDKAIDARDKADAQAWNDSLTKRTDDGLAKLNGLYPFKKDSTFQESAKKYMTHMNSISKKELKEFIDLIYAEEFTDATEARAEELLPILDDQREKLFADVQEQQKAFASKHNYTIKN